MTNPISQYEKLKQDQARIEKELKTLQEDKAFQQDMECKEGIKKLLEEHEKTPHDLFRLFPEIALSTPKAKTSRARKPSRTQRPSIRYTHPKTGEVIVSKALNNKTLQAWIQEYDLETVKSWGEEIGNGEATGRSPASAEKMEGEAPEGSGIAPVKEEGTTSQ